MTALPQAGFVDPNEVFTGRTVVLAPHMDDEVLACGATIASIRDKSNLFVIFATDGSRSPAPELRWQGRPRADLPEVRRSEAEQALGVLGITPDQLVFLGLPDGKLRKHSERLTEMLEEQFEHLNPDHILTPFRFDRHPDHLSLHAATLAAVRGIHVRVAEYFVYSQWRLLPGGDVRSFVREDSIIRINAKPLRELKLRALRCYVSQTTCWESWQQRPILTEERLRFVASDPELFIISEPGVRGRRIFKQWRLLILVIHQIEPVLKLWKERIKALVSYRPA